MLRSVGAGERVTAPGHPVATSDGRPYRDNYPETGLEEIIASDLPKDDF